MIRLLIRLGGVIHALGVAFHVALPRLANWQVDLQCLSAGKRGTLYLFNAHIGYVLLIFAILSLRYWRELVSTSLGRATTLLIAGFWYLRALTELVWNPTPFMSILGLCVVMGGLYTVVLLGNPAESTSR